MRGAYPVAAVRAAEERARAGLPEGALMARAAAAVARRGVLVLGRVYGARVVLLVGTGDNGGDALYAGALLARRGALVQAWLAGDRAHEGGLRALREAGGRVAPADGSGADLVVDGLLGIGGSGGLRPPAAALAARAAGLGAPVLAVDLPSGVAADTGEVLGAAVRADVTVAMGALKPGLVVSPGAEHAGAVECVDIGLHFDEPPALQVAEAGDVASWLPEAGAESDKYRRGVLGVVAGSAAYTGAAVLSVGAALGAGAGMVRYVGVAHPAERVRAAWPEAVVTVVAEDPDGAPDDPEAVVSAGRVQAWVVGPGLGTGPGARAVLERLAATEVPLLVDADALTLLAEHPELLAGRSAPTVLTPHAGEFGRLMRVAAASVAAARLRHAREGAERFAATLLLKGSTTVVAGAAGTWVNPTGTPLLATAGSGDVLSGACGALLAGGVEAGEAAVAAAYLHGLAARLAGGPAGHPIRAGDVISHWPRAVAAVRGWED